MKKKKQKKNNKKLKHILIPVALLSDTLTISGLMYLNYDWTYRQKSAAYVSFDRCSHLYTSPTNRLFFRLFLLTHTKKEKKKKTVTKFW